MSALSYSETIYFTARSWIAFTMKTITNLGVLLTEQTKERI